jgi:alcohol dehydrogenase
LDLGLRKVYVLTVLALVLDGSPRVTVDHPEPQRPAGEALLRVRMAGVCDTDLQLARGYMSYSGVLGHEFVGEVLEADDQRWVGQRVVADINAGCGLCADCRERDGHHCSQRSVLGILGRDGAMAERVVMPERCLVEVPPTVSDECAVFAEPLAAALHVLDETERDAPIAVVGDGKLGLLIALALHASGCRVTSIGHHGRKLDVAKQVGVRTTLEADLDPAERFDTVVEATGSGHGLTRALTIAKPRGKVILKTTIAGKHGVDLSPIVINELTLVGSRCGNMGQAVDVLSSGKLDPRPLIAARYPLDRADEALKQAATSGTLKVLIENRSSASNRASRAQS